jgi:endonuclease YncB( thermonuclease family)
MYHKLETGWGRSGGPTSAWLGIDAPEKGQAFGDRAKESLSRLVFDRQIEAHCHKRDYYGREVCKVMHAAADVNLEQIRAGMAWWYREYAKERQDREDYAREEEGANAARSLPDYRRMRSRRGSDGRGRPADRPRRSAKTMQRLSRRGWRREGP